MFVEGGAMAGEHGRAVIRSKPQQRGSYAGVTWCSKCVGGCACMCVLSRTTGLELRGCVVAWFATQSAGTAHSARAGGQEEVQGLNGELLTAARGARPRGRGGSAHANLWEVDGRLAGRQVALQPGGRSRAGGLGDDHGTRRRPALVVEVLVDVSHRRRVRQDLRPVVQARRGAEHAALWRCMGEGGAGCR